MRIRQREEERRLRQLAIKKDADECNQLTLKHHEYNKKFASNQKVKDGRFANSYAPETMRMMGAGAHIAGGQSERSFGTQRSSSQAQAALSPTATGSTRVSPDRLTTIRQKQHYEDNLRRIQQEQAKKAALRADLEKQMQAKVFKRERERLYMDDKTLVTSKGLLQAVGANLPSQRPAEETTDLNLLAKDE